MHAVIPLFHSTYMYILLLTSFDGFQLYTFILLHTIVRWNPGPLPRAVRRETWDRTCDWVFINFWRFFNPTVYIQTALIGTVKLPDLDYIAPWFILGSLYLNQSHMHRTYFNSKSEFAYTSTLNFIYVQTINNVIFL